MATSKLHVLSHPIVNARLSKLRQASTSGKEFREVSRSVSAACVALLTLMYVYVFVVLFRGNI